MSMLFLKLPVREGDANYTGSFADLDGNVWVLQELTTRLPGR